MVRRGDLVRVLHGIYLPSHLLHIVEARAAAVALTLPEGAAVCRGTAAWLYGIDTRGPGRHTELPDLECITPAGRATPPRRPGVLAFQGAIPSGDIRVVAGVPCTSPTRTALDLARWRPRFIGLAALDAFAHRRLTTVAELTDAAGRLRGQRFAARARDLVALCEPGAESAGESWLRLRLVDAGLPRPQVQIPLHRPDGSVEFRLDCGYEEARVAIEYDGEAFHARTIDQVRRDDRRRARVTDHHAWTVVGVTSESVLASRPAVEVVTADLLGWTAPLRRRSW